MCLGPALPARCSECGLRVGVPGWSMIFVTPLIVAFALSTVYLSKEAQLGVVIGTVASGCMFTLWASFVPLEKR